MKNIVTLVIVLALITCGLLWLYLDKFATKADVFAWEKNYNIHLPLWMKEMPKFTGEIEDMFEKGKAEFSGEVNEWKVSARAQFDNWLKGLEQEAKEAAAKKAHEWVDKEFGITGNAK